MSPSHLLSDLISPEYLAEQKRLHAEPRGYGGKSYKRAPVIAELIRKGGHISILDYGCGQGTLGPAVQAELGDYAVAWRNYDPAVEEWARPPNAVLGPYQLVICTDVLEHIEPDKIQAVLRHLRSLTGGQLYTVISTVETAKTLSDGRQAHILLKDWAWWKWKMIAAGFKKSAQTVDNPKPEKQLVNLWEPN